MAGARAGSEKRARGSIDVLPGGSLRVRVYAGSWHPGDTDHARHWAQLRSALSVLAPEAAAAGVVLCVENHFGTMTQTAADTARLVSEVDSPAVRSPVRADSCAAVGTGLALLTVAGPGLVGLVTVSTRSASPRGRSVRAAADGESGTWCTAHFRLIFSCRPRSTVSPRPTDQLFRPGG